MGFGPSDGKKKSEIEMLSNSNHTPAATSSNGFHVKASNTSNGGFPEEMRMGDTLKILKYPQEKAKQYSREHADAEIASI